MNTSNALDSNFEGALPSVFNRTDPIREKTVSTEENLAFGFGVVVFDFVYFIMAASAMAL